MAHFEINVSRVTYPYGRLDGRTRYVHLFATHERSLPDGEAVRNVLPGIQAAYPSPEFKVELTRFDTVGEQYSPEGVHSLLNPNW